MFTDVSFLIDSFFAVSHFVVSHLADCLLLGAGSSFVTYHSTPSILVDSHFVDVYKHHYLCRSLCQNFGVIFSAVAEPLLPVDI